MNYLALRIAGWISAICVATHAAFYWMFDWETTLDPLAAREWGVVMALTIATTYTLFAFAVLTLWRPAYLLATPLGRLLGWLIAGFWLTRAIDEFLVMATPSVVLAAFCVATALLYVIPLLRSRRHGVSVPLLPQGRTGASPSYQENGPQ